MEKLMVAIGVKLSKNDLEELCYKAGVAGVTVGTFVSDIIGDIVDGLYSGGSDERYLMIEWLKRRYDICYLSRSFLSFCVSNGYYVDDVIDAYDNMRECEENLGCPKVGGFDIDELTLDLEYYTDVFYTAFNEYKRLVPDANESYEIEVCRDWLTSCEALKDKVVKYEQENI